VAVSGSTHHVSPAAKPSPIEHRMTDNETYSQMVIAWINDEAGSKGFSPQLQWGCPTSSRWCRPESQQGIL